MNNKHGTTGKAAGDNRGAMDKSLHNFASGFCASTLALKQQKSNTDNVMKKVKLNLSNITFENTIAAGVLPARVYADRIDLLRARADILTGRDRVLLKMYLENGSTFGQMARVAGVNETTIARRIHKLIRRLLDGEYITCLRNRRRFNALEQAIARDYFIEGLSQKRIAAKRNTTVYQIRKGLKKIERVVSKDRQ